MENTTNYIGGSNGSQPQIEFNNSFAEGSKIRTEQNAAQVTEKIDIDDNTRLRAYSAMEVQAKRRPYHAARRKVESLDRKIDELEQIIKTGRKKIIKRDNLNNQTVITKILTAVQIKDTKAKLEDYKLEKKYAKEELREAEFYYGNAVNSNKNTFKNRGRTFEEKKEEKALERIYNLLDKKLQEPKKDDIEKIIALKAFSDGRVFNKKKFQSELKKCLGHLNKGNLPIIGISLEVSNKVALAIRRHKDEKKVDRVL